MESRGKPELLLYSPPRKIKQGQHSPRDNDISDKYPVPVLSCAKFQGSVWVEFGTVQVGQLHKAKFKLEVPPITEGDVLIEVDKVPMKHKISVEFNFNQQRTVVSRDNPGIGWIVWLPSEPGSMREVCSLKMAGRHRLQLTCHGEAVINLPKDTRPRYVEFQDSRSIKTTNSPNNESGISLNLSRGRSYLSLEEIEREKEYSSPEQNTDIFNQRSPHKKFSPVSSNTPPLKYCASSPGSFRPERSPPIRSESSGFLIPFPSVSELQYSAVPQTRLSGFYPATLSQDIRTQSEKTDGSYAPQKIYSGPVSATDSAQIYRKPVFDYSWADKQEVSFTCWLNYILKRVEDFGGLDEELEDELEEGSFARTDAIAFRLVLLRRYEAKVRRRARELYFSNQVQQIIYKIDERVAQGKLVIRGDRNINADVGLRSMFLDLMLSYSNAWLRLGLETVYNDSISYTGVMTSLAGNPFVPTQPEYHPQHTVASKSKRRTGAVDWYNEPVDRNSTLRDSVSPSRRAGPNTAHNRLSVSHRRSASSESLTLTNKRRESSTGIRATAKPATKPPQGRKVVTRRDFILRKYIEDRMLAMGTTTSRGRLSVQTSSSNKWGTAIKVKPDLLQHTLRYFLHLVLFLDQAKTQGILSLTPCLWKIDSRVKSSSEVLTTFCREYLEGEGDLLRTLKNMGYTVTHSQQPIDEFDFTVDNIAVDLRDGVRLVRLVELLNPQLRFSLSPKVRLPADTRLRKIHNMDVALDELKEEGVIPFNLDARDIVDGNREKTLQLLWHIIFFYKISHVVDWFQLIREIAAIKTGPSWQNRQAFGAGLLARNLAVGSEELLSEAEAPVEKEEGNQEKKQECVVLLWRWVQAVCLPYGVPILNFTSSFADGRAFCLLIHTYHPTMVRLEDISKTTACMPASPFDDTASIKTYDSSFDFETTPLHSEGLKVALRGERKNLEIARKAASHLGGVPDLLEQLIMDCNSCSCLPEERTVIMFLAYLCSRLMESRNEFRAVSTIQRAWRNKKERMKQKRRNQTAWFIFLAWRKHQGRFKKNLRKKYWWSVHKIGSWYLLQKEMRRCYQALCYHSAVWIQAAIRMFLAKKKYGLALTAVVLIQAAERRRQAKLLCRQVRHRQGYLKMEKCVTALQALVRKENARKRVNKMKFAIVTLQAWIRTQKQRNNYKSKLTLIIRAQSIIRRWNSQRMYCILKDQKKARRFCASVVLIQTYVRMHLVRTSFHILKEYIILMQSIMRRYLALAKLKRLKKGSVLAQAFIRGRLARNQALQKKNAACLLQTVFRAHVCFQKFKKLKRGVLRFQEVFRSRMGARSYAFLRSLVVIQAHARRKIAFKRYCRIRRALIIVQITWRAKLLLRSLAWQQQRQQSFQLASVYIQRVWRCFLARKRFRTQKLAALHIQQAWFYYVSKKEAFKIEREKSMVRAIILQKQAQVAAAVVIQKMWRSHQCVMCYRVLKSLLLKLQAVVRGWLTRQSLKRAQDTKVEFVAATRIMRMVRAFLKKKKLQRLLRGIVGFQALRRGFLIRRILAPQLETMRRRVLRVNAQAKLQPKLTLGSRTKHFLDVLLSTKSMTETIKCCQFLEFSTTYSKKCCEAFVDSEAHFIMFELMRSCNRSVPHQELIRHILKILCNLSRYPPLVRPISRSAGCVEILVDLIQFFRKKEEAFLLSVQLVYTLSKAEPLIQQQVSSSEIRARLDGTLSILTKQQSLVSRHGNPGRGSVSSESASISSIRKLLDFLDSEM